MQIIRNANHQYVISAGAHMTPAAEIYHNSVHAKHAHLRILTDDYRLLETSEIIPFIRNAEGLPLQVIISSEKHHCIEFLERCGFTRRRRCYEMKVSKDDLKTDLRHIHSIRSASVGDKDYEECCTLLYRYYGQTHAFVCPLTASFEEFCKSIPDFAYLLRSEDSVLCAAFVEGNELAYVCSESESVFSVFIEEVLGRLFASNPEICFEADDTDWAATVLKRLFLREADTIYDTYVLP